MNKRQKAFTLAEIFIAMVILSVLVSVCLTFFAQRHDYEREYFYYTAYKNLVNVVDSALFNDVYLKGINARTEETTCGTATELRECRAFKVVADGSIGLCSIFEDYFNTAKIYNNSGTEVAPCLMATTDPKADAAVPALRLTNGMDIYFKSFVPANITDLADGTLSAAEVSGYELWVDINGRGQGEDKMNYDIFKFYITRDGRVIPVYGTVDPGIRGYEYLPADMDGGGNPELTAFDVVFKLPDSNYLQLENAITSTTPEGSTVTTTEVFRSVPFPRAACASGYISDQTEYCKKFKYDCNDAGTSCTEGVTKAVTCDYIYSDCKIRLVKKLKRIK